VNGDLQTADSGGGLAMAALALAWHWLHVERNDPNKKQNKMTKKTEKQQ